MSIKWVMPSNHLILCHPLLLLLSVFPSITVFSIGASGSFPLEYQLQHQSFNEYSGLISFRMDWLDLLAVQKSTPNHSLKASILWRSAFFVVQLSHPYITTRKTIALTRWTFVGKVMLFNMLFKLVIAFLPRASVF